MVELAEGAPSERMVGKEVIACGDGQCDSPGHTPKNLCYFLMELVSGYVALIVFIKITFYFLIM